MSSFFLVIVSFVTLSNAADSIGITPSKCECMDSSGNCNTIFQCFADPCDSTKCNDGEYCTTQYCGGCTAKCLSISLPAGCATIRCMSGTQCCDDGSGAATCCTCDKLGLCTDPISGACNTEVLCTKDPCDTNNGGCAATQRCSANYCGGCNAICEDCVCSREYIPVCCDGTTYSNKCGASCAIATNCVDGECPTKGCAGSDMNCITLYDPVCCDGVTYSNKCTASAKCAENCVEGACSTGTDEPTTTGCTPDKLAVCRDVFAPVCCDGVTYSSKCNAAAECAENCEEGACSTSTDEPTTTGCIPDKRAVCSDIGVTPVCCDGVDYCCKCRAEAECAENCKEGACSTTDEPTTTGCTPGKLSICRDIYAPVCCDGVTYSSKCNAAAQCAENCEDGECSSTDEPTTTGCTPIKLPICPTVAAPVCCDGVQYGNKCKANAACAENCEAGVCSTDATSTTDTETPVGCTEESVICSDDSVLSRSATLDCDFKCPDDGCSDTVCCDDEAMAECVAINECEAEEGFTDVPDACLTKDILRCPDGETFISRLPENCCQFDEDDCDADDPTYCDAKMVRSKRASLAVDIDVSPSSNIAKLIANCQLCLCSEVGQRRCQNAADFENWKEDNVYRTLFTEFCLADIEDYPALAADDAGTICEWSSVSVKDVADIEGCDCSAFYCTDGSNYEPSLYQQSDAGTYGMMIGFGSIVAMFWI